MKASWLAMLFVPIALGGCATYHYRVERDEARRALAELTGKDNVVVDAVDLRHDRKVRLKLAADDEVRILTLAGNEALGPTAQTRASGPHLDPLVVEAMELEEEPRGRALLILGAIPTAAGLLGGLIIASLGPTLGRQLDKAAIPIFGPTALAVEQRSIGMGALAGVQVVGIGLLVAGIALSGPTHEVSDEAPAPSAASHWPLVTFAPTPGGGAGLQVLATF